MGENRVSGKASLWVRSTKSNIIHFPFFRLFEGHAPKLLSVAQHGHLAFEVHFPRLQNALQEARGLVVLPALPAQAPRAEQPSEVLNSPVLCQKFFCSPFFLLVQLSCLQ